MDCRCTELWFVETCEEITWDRAQRDKQMETIERNEEIWM